MGELAGRTGSANPALQGLRVRVPCASVRVRARPCARVSACPACSQEGRAGSRRPGVARVSPAGGGVPGPPLSVPLRSLGFAGGPCAGQQQRAPRGPPPGQPKGRAGAPLLWSRGAL